MGHIGYERHQARLAALRNGPWKALFPGICSRCSERFAIGDPIARRGDTYMHANCAPGGDDE